jgi:hypothetical protein
MGETGGWASGRYFLGSIVEEECVGEGVGGRAGGSCVST